MNERFSAIFFLLVIVIKTKQQEMQFDAADAVTSDADFAPRAPEDHMNVRFDKLGMEAIIQIRISAKPTPSITWSFGSHVHVGPGFVTPDHRIQVLKQEKVGPDLYLCRLVISSLELKDTQIMYEMTAANSRGTAKFQFQVNVPNRVEMSGQSLEDGHSPGTLVTISLLSFTVVALMCVLCTRGAACQTCRDSCEFCSSSLSCSKCVRQCP